MSFTGRMTLAIAAGMALFAWTAAGQETPAKEGQRTLAAASAPDLPVVPTDTDAKALAETATAAPVIQSHKDKISYAYGVGLGRDLQRVKGELNLNLLIRALADTLSNKPLIMTDEEVRATVKQAEAEQKQDFEHVKVMISRKNKEAGETFFAENLKKQGVVTLPNGLQYKILKKGDGKIPTLDDKVVCEYKGTLLDGTVFDSSEKRGHALTLPVKGLMPGLTQALQMMPVGSKWQLFLPPQLAYGENVVNGVGPNSTLIFELDLVSIEGKPQTASAK